MADINAPLEYDAADEKKGPWPPGTSKDVDVNHPSVQHQSAADKPVEERWSIEVPPGYQGEPVAPAYPETASGPSQASTAAPVDPTV